MTVNIEELGAHTRQVLRRVAEGEEIVISDGGRPLARLTPIRERPKRVLGTERGRIWIADDFDELPEEIRKAFE